MDVDMHDFEERRAAFQPARAATVRRLEADGFTVSASEVQEWAGLLQLTHDDLDGHLTYFVGPSRRREDGQLVVPYLIQREKSRHEEVAVPDGASAEGIAVVLHGELRRFLKESVGATTVPNPGVGAGLLAPETADLDAASREHRANPATAGSPGSSV